MIPIKIENYSIGTEEERVKVREALLKSYNDKVKNDIRTHCLIGSIDIKKDTERVQAVLPVDIAPITDNKNFVNVFFYHKDLTVYNNEVGYDFQNDKRIFITFKKRGK